MLDVSISPPPFFSKVFPVWLITQSRPLTPLEKKAFENIEGKGEKAGNA